jgi:hypothetical protein
MRLLWCETSVKPLLRPIGIGAFAFYVGWNLAWLLRGRIPDSLLHSFTGWPCPTTGGIRSLRAFFAGHLTDSLLYNPLTGVYLLLLVLTGCALWRQLSRRHSWSLPPALAWGWCAALMTGWLLKFVLGPAYW